MIADTIERTYYLTKEVAEILQENDSTVRYWMDVFGLDVGKSHGKKRFSKNNIADLHRIKYLIRDERLTIEGAKKKFRNHDKALADSAFKMSAKTLEKFLKEEQV